MPSVVQSQPTASAASTSPPPEGADTTPGTPVLELSEEEELAALLSHIDDARLFLRNRDWDNLAHVQRFASCAALAARLLERHDEDSMRRRVLSMLWPLLPVSARMHACHELPALVDARAPHFLIHDGDVPRIAPVYCAFLTPKSPESRELIESLLTPGAGPLLAPRGVCPGAARGTCTTVTLKERGPSSSLLPQPKEGAAPAWRCTIAPADVGLPDAALLSVRIGPDGQPLRASDGREEPITVSDDVLEAWLFSAGPDARGLDLRSEDDRALLLCWAHALRDVVIDDKSAFTWLEDAHAPLTVRVRVVESAVACAIEVVARFALDALACRISLRATAEDGGWTKVAAAALDACALCHDVLARDDTGGRDLVWLNAFLRPGFAGGRLTPLAAGRSFARLATSVLAPLGVLPLSGCKDGSGAVLLQRLVESEQEESGVRVRRAPLRLVSFEDAGARDEPLLGKQGAWAAGRGLALPDPKGAPRHDVAAVAGWLVFFLAGLS